MPGPLLDEKIVAIARTLRDESVSHAFGGALALAYYATPRGTQDIDVNVFLPTSEADPILELLVDLGVDRPGRSERDRLLEEGQVRVHWGHTPVDLFFSYDPLHASCVERIKTVPFGADARIEILSAEDLVIFKALFDRPKDWSDIRELLFAQGGDFDPAYALDWLRRILGEGDPRLLRFEELVTS